MKVITTNLLNRFWKNGVKPIKDSLTAKVDTSKIVNSLLTTAAGFALDARQGKVLDDKITSLNSNLSLLGSEMYGTKVDSITKAHAMSELAGITIPAGTYLLGAYFSDISTKRNIYLCENDSGSYIQKGGVPASLSSGAFILHTVATQKKIVAVTGTASQHTFNSIVCFAIRIR